MSIYLDRYCWPTPLFPDYSPNRDLEMMVVIPCYNEPDIEKALRFLDNSIQPCRVLVLVVINESQKESDEVRTQNLASLKQVKQLQSELSIEIIVTYQQLPPKKAGVGLARKIGMDEATRFFEKLSKDGIIVCYDADCTCEPNYLEAIYQFYGNQKMEAGIVHYEHHLEPNTEAIINYEIYLRYYINALRYAGFPYAYQTLGSCITVKSKRYQKEGGMNKRKAGEDFYFLHKVIPNEKFGEINTTSIHPSARISDRVPFGTGHAIDKYLHQASDDYMTYNPEIFEELRKLINQVESWYLNKSPTVSNCIQQFLDENDFQHFYAEMLRQSTDLNSFRKRFFSWLDGFQILKFVHFARDQYYPNVELNDAIRWIDKKLSIGLSFESLESTLNEMRDYDKHVIV